MVTGTSIHRDIKKAGMQMTMPRLRGVFTPAEAGVEAEAAELQTAELGEEAQAENKDKDNPSLGDMFKLAGGQNAQNQRLLAMASGNADGVQVRGAALEKHNRAVRERTARGKNKDTALWALLEQIETLNAELASIEDGLRGRYGENFAEVIAAKYLDAETAQRQPDESDEDYQKRIAQELDKRIDAGLIDPDDPLVKDWIETHAKLAEKRDQRQTYIAENAEELAANGALENEEAADLWQAEDRVAQSTTAAVQDGFVENSSVDESESALADVEALFADNGLSITVPPEAEIVEAAPVPDQFKLG